MPADENLSIPEREKKWRLGFWSLIAAQFRNVRHILHWLNIVENSPRTMKAKRRHQTIEVVL